MPKSFVRRMIRFPSSTCFNYDHYVVSRKYWWDFYNFAVIQNLTMIRAKNYEKLSKIKVMAKILSVPFLFGDSHASQLCITFFADTCLMLIGVTALISWRFLQTVINFNTTWPICIENMQLIFYVYLSLFDNDDEKHVRCYFL